MPPKREPNIQRLEKAIANFRQLLGRIITFQTTQLETANLKTCQYQLKFLTQGYNEFLDNQSAYELCELENGVDHDAVRAEVDEAFLTCAPEIETRIEEIKSRLVAAPPPADLGAAPQVCPKLPEISLELFTGDNVTKWPEFLAQFDGIVHSNPNLNVISKFQYLRGALSGPARAVIENLPVTVENYEDARQMLITEYDNPKRICEQHIKALFTFKALDKACPKRLSELLSHFNSHVRSLTNQNRPTNHWDDLLVFLISSKFDYETRNKWIETAPTTRLATVADITSFIRTRCLKLGAQSESFHSKTTHAVKSPPQTNSRSSYKPHAHALHASSTKTLNCDFCKTSGHSIMRCSTFKSYSIDQRRDAIQKEQLCFNCMRPNHSARSCPVKNLCHVCQRKHHTMLHRDGEANTDTATAGSVANTSNAVQPFSGACHNQSSSTITTPVSSYVVLATAMVNVYDKFDTPFRVRAILDAGSQVNFITQSLAIHVLGFKLNQTTEQFLELVNLV